MSPHRQRISPYTNTRRRPPYFTEFPEDIRLIGASFNTQLQSSGIALQGEIAYRQNQPLQYDDVELLFSALGPFENGIAALRGTPLPSSCLPGAGATLYRCNQLGAFGLNDEIRGWSLKDTWQAQFTATRTFANIFRAAQMVLVFECGELRPRPREQVHGRSGGARAALQRARHFSEW